MRGIPRKVVGLTSALCMAGALPHAARAQDCQAPPHPYFEFQVQTRAQFIPDSTVSPRPTLPQPGGVAGQAALVQFVVDTSGVPDGASYKVLSANDRTLVIAGRAALPRWRFRPARVDGCPVPQLVQTPLAR